MNRQNPSIFNDIVGPVMVGPSSSHTCGPSRIGYLSVQLLETPLKKAVIEFAKEGAYTNMYKGQRSDMGFVNGLLGFRPEDPRLRDCFKLAKEKNITVSFEINDFEPIVPNIAKINLYGENGEHIIVYSDSTGGGTVKLFKIDGFDVAIVGDCYEVLLVCNENQTEYIKNQLSEQFPINEGIFSSQQGSETLINLKLREAVSREAFHIDCKNIKILTPILAVASHRNTILPFVSAEDLLKLSQKTGQNLFELGVAYEMARSGMTKKEVLDYMEYVVKTMEASVYGALKGDIDMSGILQPTSGKILNYMETNSNALSMGVLDFAVPWSMATMEYSSSMGIVLCAPTGGSAGVFPGAVLGVLNKLNANMEKKIEAMFVTSAIGIAMSKDCNYSAELYGCQVEPGAASAMAAGALAYIMGGDTKQCLDAASCAIQNILGTICDPVAGLVQLPCISRNAMSAANAVVCANMIMGGFDPLIPLDESAETMFRVGKQLPSELRCTCKGGLCTTPTGQRLAKEQDERDSKRA